ncbi:PIG-L deacetylase family protein [Rubellimicrobium arenae]|uniref:PIG-L deacetylase family protein n=1 Tax=Rubellimicrobium arenae TaxID=2817372 RepID=UPI001B300646|nr:PIG-L family deacetylase [Rubellimicrobium arenae]
MTDLPGRLARRERIPERVVLVVAHPDDETLALASRLDCLEDLSIIHLTDGAPRDLRDARQAGVDTVENYAELRRQELRTAMAALGSTAELRCYWHPDQEAILHGAAIVQNLVRDLWGAGAVITHPYEHGHPDHDAAALCVALACRRFEAERRPVPDRFEFPSYHLRQGQARFGEFWPDASAPETAMPLSDDDRARRRAGLACFGSQQAFLSHMPEMGERLRPAPAYDFRAPAPSGQAWYDQFGWTMNLAAWRRHADALLDQAPA